MRIASLALLIALPLGASGASQFAGSSAPASAASAGVRFVINVPRILKLHLLDHPRTLEVSPQDLVRGHVVVRGPRLDILANDRAGYRLRAALSGTAFDAVEVVGLDARVSANRDGTVVRMPSQSGKSRAPRAVEYVLKLGRDARPGVYHWPVALSLEQP